MNNSHILKWIKSTSEKIIGFLGSDINLFVYWGSEPVECLNDLRPAFFYEFSSREKKFVIVFSESGYCELMEEFTVFNSKAILHCDCVNSEQIFLIEKILLENLSLNSIDCGLVNGV